MMFEEKIKHEWSCDISRGDRPCRWVLPNDDGFLCCTWKEDHPASLPHEIVDNQTEAQVLAQEKYWEYRPNLSIFEMGRYWQ
jgi:hypothetical protein